VTSAFIQQIAFTLKFPLLLSYLFFSALTVWAQKEANVWYFGYKAGLDFSCAPPKAISGSMHAPE
jgi:hypothetical protein